jgi:hypothetical protein
MDTSELEAAYRSVLDLAARGAGPSGAGPSGAGAAAGAGPEAAGSGDGEAWGPDDVLAHLVLNDRLLARAVRSVLDGTAQPYDNLDAIDVAELRTLTEDLGDTAGLIGGLEASSRELMDLAGRLDEAQGATPVPVRILDGDQLVVDNPLPVRSLLNIQARRHLPMHLAQLSELLGQR